MSNYTPSVDFAAKDDLTTGDPNKVVKGAEISSELTAIQTAVNSKADSASPTLTGSGTAVDLTVSGTLNASGTLQVGGVAVTATAAELNLLDGVTATTAELNVLDGITATTAELNKIDGFTGVVADLNYAKDLRATGVTATEFDYLDGVTDPIQTQINLKSPITSPEFLTNISVGGSPSSTLASFKDSAVSGRALEVRVTTVNGFTSSAYEFMSTPENAGSVLIFGTRNTERLRVGDNGNIIKGGSSGPLWASGSGTPEGSITAPVGSFYSRTDGGTGTSFYVKESGSGNTGWVAK